MQLAQQKQQSDRDELEPILYAALINSMVQNFWAIFLGSASAAVAAVMTAVKTGDVLLWPIAFLIIAIGTARAFQMRAYENRTVALTFEEAKHLEPRYWVGALAYAAVLGLWSFIVIYNNDDPVADMLVATVVVGYTAGGAARNYGQPRVIQWHVVLACGPMSLALVLNGGLYYVGLAILLVMFFVGLKNINLSLHAIFVKAFTSSFRESALASQFDTALNNMPHGLCMFRADRRLAVMNHRFSELTELPDDLVKRGVNAVDIVSACVAGGAISAESGNLILCEIEDGRIRELVTTDPDFTRGRTLSWTFQPMAGGGTVVLRATTASPG